MKNIQIIERRINSKLAVYCMNDDDFMQLFPNQQDMAFLEEIYLDFGVLKASTILSRLQEIDKKQVNGIDGTLFIGYHYLPFWNPTHKENESLTYSEYLHAINPEEYPDATTKEGLKEPDIPYRDISKHPNMKTIQIVDYADNATFSIYAIEQEKFEKIFPHGKEIEFSDFFFDRLGEKKASRIYQELWTCRVDRKKIHGIDGTLYFGEYYQEWMDDFKKNGTINYNKKFD